MVALAPDLAASLTRRAEAAAAFWHPRPVIDGLLKYRENAVFRVAFDGRPAALRLHRPAYHEPAALRSELDWMHALRQRGLPVPGPLAARDGGFLCPLPAAGGETQHADLLSWVEGAPLGASGAPLALPPAAIAPLFHRFGALIGRIHRATDGWTPPPGFTRPRLDLDGLLGERPVWGRFWDHPRVAPAAGRRLAAIRERVRARLSPLAARFDHGLIHADLVRENVLVRGEDIAVIDFDDSAHGWRLYDIAVVLTNLRAEPRRAEMRAALIAGYRGARDLPDWEWEMLPWLMLVRQLSYVGWMAERPEIPGAARRLPEFVADGLAAATALGLD